MNYIFSVCVQGQIFNPDISPTFSKNCLVLLPQLCTLLQFHPQSLARLAHSPVANDWTISLQLNKGILFQQHQLLFGDPAQELEGAEAHGEDLRVPVAEQFL